MTVTQLVQEAKQLSPGERRRLVEALKELFARERGKRASKKARAGLKNFVALAGKAESAFNDVSSDKYKHLGDIYS